MEIKTMSHEHNEHIVPLSPVTWHVNPVICVTIDQ